MNRNKVMSTLLYLGVLFYVLGAVIHFFGLSVYPWFVSELHSSYHDTLIAISSLVMAIFFFQAAQFPANKPLIDAIIAAGFLGGILIIAMGVFVDFESLNASVKAQQAVLEGLSAIVLSVLLLFLSKKR